MACARMVCGRKLNKQILFGKEAEEPWKIFEGKIDDEMCFLTKVEKKYSGSKTRVCGKGSWRILDTAPKRAYASQNGLLGVQRDFRFDRGKKNGSWLMAEYSLNNPKLKTDHQEELPICIISRVRIPKEDKTDNESNMPCSKKRTRDICESAPSSKRPALIQQTNDLVVLALPCKVPVLEKTMVNTRSTTNNKCSGKPTVKRPLQSDNPVQDIPAACPRHDGDQCTSGVPSISQTDDQDQLDQDLPYGVEDLMYLDTPEFRIECVNFAANVDLTQGDDDLHKFFRNFGL